MMTVCRSGSVNGGLLTKTKLLQMNFIYLGVWRNRECLVYERKRAYVAFMPCLQTQNPFENQGGYGIKEFPIVLPQV